MCTSAATGQLTHARVQDEAAGATVIARTDAVLAREAVYRRLDLELGAALSRHELNVAPAGRVRAAACQRRVARRPASATSTPAWASTTPAATAPAS